MRIKTKQAKPTLESLLRRRSQTLQSWMQEMSLSDADAIQAYCDSHGLAVDMVPLRNTLTFLDVVKTVVESSTVEQVQPVVSRPKRKQPRSALVELSTDEKKPAQGTEETMEPVRGQDEGQREG